MTKDEAMRLALDALENAPLEYDFHGDPMDTEFGLQKTAAIIALHQALAAPEQEPVAWMRKWAFDGEKPCKEKNANGRMAWPIRFKVLPVTRDKHFHDDVALYTAPVAAPQQPVSMETVYDTIIEWSTAGKGSRRELARRMIALFAAPQREWQDLTKAEINDCAGAEIYSSSWAMAFARAIESKLKEKNT